MSHWAFVAAAYAVAIGATGGLVLLAWRSMRAAEAQAETLRDRQ